MDKKTKRCYNAIDKQIGSIESEIEKLQKHLRELKSTIKKADFGEPEVCPDERASERAIKEAIQIMYAEGLVDTEPAGEA